jgi:hypothetical protein
LLRRAVNVLLSSHGRRYSLFTNCSIVAAGDYVRLRSLRFAPTHIHRPYSRRYRGGCNIFETNNFLRNRFKLSAQSLQTLCAIASNFLRNRPELSAQRDIAD